MSSLLRIATRGTVAGLLGSAAMHAFRICWERATRHRQRDAIFGFDREADTRSAQMVHSWLLRDSLSAQRAARLGIGLHYTYGALLGILFAAVEEHFGRIGMPKQPWIALLLWLCADEIPISLCGFSDPFERSAASHASALTAHLLFASTVEAALGVRDLKRYFRRTNDDY